MLVSLYTVKSIVLELLWASSGYASARGNSNLFIYARLYSPLGGVPNQRNTFYRQLVYIAILLLFSSVSKLTD